MSWIRSRDRVRRSGQVLKCFDLASLLRILSAYPSAARSSVEDAAEATSTRFPEVQLVKPGAGADFMKQAG